MNRLYSDGKSTLVCSTNAPSSDSNTLLVLSRYFILIVPVPFTLKRSNKEKKTILMDVTDAAIIPLALSIVSYVPSVYTNIFDPRYSLRLWNVAPAFEKIWKLLFLCPICNRSLYRCHVGFLAPVSTTCQHPIILSILTAAFWFVLMFFNEIGFLDKVATISINRTARIVKESLRIILITPSGPAACRRTVSKPVLWVNRTDLKQF